MSRYSQVWVAFAVSAATHHAGAVVGCFEDGGLSQGTLFHGATSGYHERGWVIGWGKTVGGRKTVYSILLALGGKAKLVTVWTKHLDSFGSSSGSPSGFTSSLRINLDPRMRTFEFPASVITCQRLSRKIRLRNGHSSNSNVYNRNTTRTMHKSPLHYSNTPFKRSYTSSTEISSWLQQWLIRV
jgi:hypothetical protein